jgi:hypothetical protein
MYVLMSSLRFAMTHPMFAGVANWPLLKQFMAGIEALFSLPEARAGSMHACQPCTPLHALPVPRH